MGILPMVDGSPQAHGRDARATSERGLPASTRSAGRATRPGGQAWRGERATYRSQACTRILPTIRNDAWKQSLRRPRLKVGRVSDPPLGRSQTCPTLGLIAAFLCFLAAPARSAEPARTIIFFGDSITAGYGLADPATEAYPALIQAKINVANLGWRVINAGLSGETTSGGLRRVDWTLRTPVDVFVLALGGNDGLRGISPTLSRTNLEQIIQRVRTKYPQARIVLAGMEMPPEMGRDYTREFAAVFPTVAQKSKVIFIPFLLEGVGGSVELNQGDRIHPSPAGHVAIAETVWKVLRPLL